MESEIGVEARAYEDVESLGMTFTAFPPGYPAVKQVSEASWAESVGIQQGYIVFEVNGLDLIRMSKEDFNAQLKIRPLVMYVEPPTPPPSEDEGAAHIFEETNQLVRTRPSRRSTLRQSLAHKGQVLELADPDGMTRKRPSKAGPDGRGNVQSQALTDSADMSKMTASRELTPEELVSRMTDEELLGLTPPNSRPGSAKRRGPGLGALVPPVKQHSRPSSAAIKEDEVLQLSRSSSLPAVGTLRPCSAAEVKAQRKVSFHFKRQRRWLEVHNKQHCLSFTEQEMIDFRRFFDALAKGKDTIPLDRFEDMLVCLDLAKSRRDVRGFTAGIQQDIHNKEISFDAFMKSFESQLDTATMDVLKQLIQGGYDSRDLDYLTFISERRRELIFSATGARDVASQRHSSQIVRTFSDLWEDRCYEDFGMGVSNKSTEDGVSLMGGLGTMWQVACVQHQLARTLTAEERSASVKKSVPMSPRAVINNIVKATGPKTLGVHRLGTTLMIEADRISA